MLNSLRSKSCTTRNGVTINYTYDALDRVTQASFPEGPVTYSYDADSNLTSVGNYNGAGQTFAYDNLNRVTQTAQTLPNGFSASLSYA